MEGFSQSLAYCQPKKMRFEECLQRTCFYRKSSVNKKVHFFGAVKVLFLLDEFLSWLLRDFTLFSDMHHCFYTGKTSLSHNTSLTFWRRIFLSNSMGKHLSNRYPLFSSTFSRFTRIQESLDKSVGKAFQFLHNEYILSEWI